MKKILLSMAAVALCAGAAMANEVTFNFVPASDATTVYGYPVESGNSQNYITTPASMTEGNATITLDKTSGSGFRFWSDGLRIYKTGSGYCSMAINIPGATVTDIEMTTKNGDYSAVYVAATAGTDGTEATKADKVYNWSGSIENPVITITTAKNSALQSIKITYTTGGTELLPAGLVFSEKNVNAILGQPFAAPTLTKATDATVAYSSSNPEVATVNATTGAVTLVAAGTTTITASCAATSVYNAGSDSYTLNVMGSYNSIADFYTLSKGGKGVINFPLTITYQNGVNTYVTDGTGYSLIYGSIGTYEVGTIIPAGWVGELDIFNNLPEIKPVGDMTEPTENEEFTPRAVTAIDESMLNEIVILSGVTFAEETPADKSNFTGAIGDEEFTFRNNFEIESVAAGTYDVKCAVAIFKTTLQLYPISYNEPVVDGISEIETSNGAAVYYNMQGVRVSNPENGMFIRVEGNKATKVIIK